MSQEAMVDKLHCQSCCGVQAADLRRVAVASHGRGLGSCWFSLGHFRSLRWERRARIGRTDTKSGRDFWAFLMNSSSSSGKMYGPWGRLGQGDVCSSQPQSQRPKRVDVVSAGSTVPSVALPHSQITPNTTRDSHILIDYTDRGER